MHGLQACLFKYITVAEFHINAQCGEKPLKGEVGGHALNSHTKITLLIISPAVFRRILGGPGT